MWDPASPGAWTQLANLPGPPRTSHRPRSCSATDIVAGGERDHEDPTDAVFGYDPLTDTWETLTPLPAERFSGVARAIEGVIYFTGGSSTTTTYRGVFAG